MNIMEYIKMVLRNWGMVIKAILPCLLLVESAVIDTGDVKEFEIMTLNSCSTGFYIYINSASYTASFWCSDPNAKSDVEAVCQNQNTCSFTVGAAVFGTDCDTGLGNMARVTYFCALDGDWSDWGAWDSCSVTCGSGMQGRTRTCTNPTPVDPGNACSGPSTVQQSCNSHICPVDGGWTDWTAWADCTVTCEYGVWNRTRTCTNPAPVGTGAKCTGDTMESTSCYPVVCPVDGMWGGWTAWGACSVTCATGTKHRTRNCDNPAKVGAGSDCVGNSSETQSCFVSDVCPVYNTGTLNENSQLDISCPGNLSYYVYIAAGYYGNPQYGSSTVCQASGATTTFTSACHGNTECSVTMNDATFGGDPCAYTTTTYSKSYYTQQFSKQCSQYSYTLLKTTYSQCYESRTLSRQNSHVNHDTRTKYGHLQYHCARDGVWSDWSEWTTCTVTCDSGTKDRNRTCNNPEMYAPGMDCAGSSTETTDCHNQACPVDGGWTDWAAWGSCSVTCDGSIHSRTRSCTSPSPVGTGLDCSGDKQEAKACNPQACPVDGGWTDWAGWGSCSVTCDGGIHSRTRSCTSPSPVGTGLDCSGDKQETKACNPQACPVDGGWTDWAGWGSCSVTCDGGIHSRTRSCTSPSPVGTGLDCSGDKQETKACNPQACPVDGGWTDWAGWGSCSVTCDGSIHSRTRSCTSPSPAGSGLDCSGDTQESQACNSQACPAVNPPDYGASKKSQGNANPVTGFTMMLLCVILVVSFIAVFL